MPDKAYLEWPAVVARKEEDLREPALVAKARLCARSMVWLPGIKTSLHFSQRLERLHDRMQAVVALVQNAAPSDDAAQDAQRWLEDNLDFLRAELAGLQESSVSLTRTVHVRYRNREATPRVLVIAEDLLTSLNYGLDDPGFSTYVHAFQTLVVLRLGELWALVPALKLVLLERIAALATQSLGNDGSARDNTGIKTGIRSLRDVAKAPWEELLGPLIVFDQVLRRDPAGAYARMDAETREMYRQAVVKLAEYSDYAEIEIAEMAVSLARQSLGRRERDLRLALRRSHVGYYLLAEGRELLCRRAGVRLPFRDRFQEFLRRHPDEFYLLGIEILTVSMILAVLWWVNFSSLWSAFFAALALLLP